MWQYPRLMRRLTPVLLTAVALAVPASTAEAERLVFFSDGCGTSVHEPAEVVLTCGDAKLRLVGLTWTQWDGSSATATGLLSHPDLNDPSCKGSLVGCTVRSETPATVRIWRPVKCPGNDVWQFTRLRAEAPEDPEPDVRVVSRDYRCREFANPPSKTEPLRRYFVRFSQAEAWMRTALRQREFFQFEKANNRAVRCRWRVSRDRVRCKMGWSLGDEIHFHGRGTIWITYASGAPRWSYAYRVEGVNEYCLRVGGGNCRKTWTVR
jgi:hypothetical protein